MVSESPKDTACIEETGGHVEQRSSTSLDVLISTLRPTYNIDVGDIETTRPDDLASRSQGHHVHFQHHQKRANYHPQHPMLALCYVSKLNLGSGGQVSWVDCKVYEGLL